MRRTAPIINRGTRWFVRTSMLAILLSSLVLLVFVSAGHGQEVEDVAPPPLKMIPKDEKARLTAETQPKSRTNLALQMMTESLARAEQLDSKNKFVEMYRELGTFHAIMDDTLKFLNSQRDDAVLKNFKKLEMGLRLFTPKLEVIRRDLPIQYEPYVKSLIKYVQDTREKAIEPFFGNTVVPNSRNQ